MNNANILSQSSLFKIETVLIQCVMFAGFVFVMNSYFTV